MSTHLLIATFHETAIKYESELKNLFVLLDISKNQNVGLPRYLHFKFCQMIYLFKTFIMLQRIFTYVVSYFTYDLSKISAKLAISLKHNIIFAKFLEIQLDNNINFFAYTHSLTKQKSLRSHISLYFPILC